MGVRIPPRLYINQWRIRMPLKQCGDNGWKWGDQGKCFTGPGAKKKAIKQGIAIEGPEKFKQKAAQELDIEESDVIMVADAMYEEKFSTRDIVETMLSLSATKYIYEDPKTGEQYTYRRMGNHRKNGRVLMYVGKAGV